ncbi:MAG: nucleotidyl transferase AbiEii/AbiGii toxin family protein [Chlorobiaceae bacterium]
MPQFLHNHKEFNELISIVANNMAITPALVEKDYWIMHCLYGLQKMELTFELKGGTSLSKGFGIIERFSEDIDIRIEPPAEMNVKTGQNHEKPAHCESRMLFYDWLASNITINGIQSVSRDKAFDDSKYRSGGIRLHYKSSSASPPGLKEGILLEVGFDDVAPNTPKEISSWAYDYATARVPVIDNRAKSIPCYNPGFTPVEKLQTISTKYRLWMNTGKKPDNFIRHYYDIYCLLQSPEVLAFIGTPPYQAHKEKRFPKRDNLVLATNEAFLLHDTTTRNQYRDAYEKTQALYYKTQPQFDRIIERIQKAFALGL